MPLKAKKSIFMVKIINNSPLGMTVGGTASQNQTLPNPNTKSSTTYTEGTVKIMLVAMVLIFP